MTSDVYRCVDCGGGVHEADGALACTDCGRNYPMVNGIAMFGSEHEVAMWTAYHTTPFGPHHSGVQHYKSDVPSAAREIYTQFIPGEATRVLDAGGGDGNTTADWAARHPSAAVHVMDLSLHGLMKVQRRGLANMIPVCASADIRFPYADDYFDVVSTVFMVEHMACAALERFYAQAMRVLRPGGHLVVASDTPIFDRFVHPLVRVVRQGRYVPNNPTHINLMTPRQCEAGVRAAGFEPAGREIHWVAGRFSLVRLLYRLLPSALAEAAFSTMYIVVARKTA